MNPTNYIIATLVLLAIAAGGKLLGLATGRDKSPGSTCLALAVDVAFLVAGAVVLAQ